MVQGVPAKDVIQEAKITIMGGKVFQKVASANCLKKRDLILALGQDTRTYNQQVFSLDSF